MSTLEMNECVDDRYYHRTVVNKFEQCIPEYNTHSNLYRKLTLCIGCKCIYDPFGHSVRTRCIYCGSSSIETLYGIWIQPLKIYNVFDKICNAFFPLSTPFGKIVVPGFWKIRKQENSVLNNVE